MLDVRCQPLAEGFVSLFLALQRKYHEAKERTETDGAALVASCNCRVFIACPLAYIWRGCCLHARTVLSRLSTHRRLVFIISQGTEQDFFSLVIR